MILLVHMFFGAAVGYKIYLLTQSVSIAFVAAFLSHYAIDIFPHIEYPFSVEESVEKIKRRRWSGLVKDATKVGLDFLAGALLVFFFASNQPVVYLFVFAAIIPDGLTVTSRLFPNRILTIHERIHNETIHYLTKKKKFSLFWRIFTQLAAVAVGILIFTLR